MVMCYKQTCEIVIILYLEGSQGCHFQPTHNVGAATEQSSTDLATQIPIMVYYKIHRQDTCRVELTLDDLSEWVKLHETRSLLPPPPPVFHLPIEFQISMTCG